MARSSTACHCLFLTVHTVRDCLSHHLTGTDKSRKRSKQMSKPALTRELWSQRLDGHYEIFEDALSQHESPSGSLQPWGSRCAHSPIGTPVMNRMSPLTWKVPLGALPMLLEQWQIYSRASNRLDPHRISSQLRTITSPSPSRHGTHATSLAQQPIVELCSDSNSDDDEVLRLTRTTSRKSLDPI